MWTRAGQTHDSSASGLPRIERLGPGLNAPRLDTVLAPVSWGPVEPAAGHVDFLPGDALLTEARERGRSRS